MVLKKKAGVLGGEGALPNRPGLCPQGKLLGAGQGEWGLSSCSVERSVAQFGRQETLVRRCRNGR